MPATETPVDRPHRTGWTLEVRRIVPCAPDAAWELLSDEWLPQWLGVDTVPLLVGAPVRQGIRAIGRVVGCHVGFRMRLRWDQPTAADETVLQVTLVPEGSASTTVVVEQERLASAEERDRLREHWERALERLDHGAVR